MRKAEAASLSRNTPKYEIRLGRNIALLNAVKQMSVQTPWQILAANFRNKSLAVKAAGHCGLQANDLGRVVGGCQALGQIAEFIRAELPAPSKLEGMLNNFGLFLAASFEAP